jgi:hypothetical protein
MQYKPTRLIYPEDLINSAKGNRPMMRMRCDKPNIEEGDPKPIDIYVPIPVGITFEDGASYNDAELGILGGSTMYAARNISAGASTGRIAGAVDAAIESGQKALGSVTGKNVVNLITAGIGKGLGIDSEIQSGVSIGMGTTLNKNVTTEFTGVGTRNFSFSFKFVSKSEEETLVIKNIIEALRSNLYPMGNFISLQYPPTWNIQFLEAVVEGNTKLTNLDGTDIPYLPKIFQCYLKGLTSNFNPTANVWRRDGSPIETDVTVQFVESRALTYEDIKRLEAKAFKEGDSERLYGGGTEKGARNISNSSATSSTFDQLVPRDSNGFPVPIKPGYGMDGPGPQVDRWPAGGLIPSDVILGKGYQ